MSLASKIFYMVAIPLGMGVLTYLDVQLAAPAFGAR